MGSIISFSVPFSSLASLLFLDTTKYLLVKFLTQSPGALNQGPAAPGASPILNWLNLRLFAHTRRVPSHNLRLYNFT